MNRYFPHSDCWRTVNLFSLELLGFNFLPYPYRAPSAPTWYGVSCFAKYLILTPSSWEIVHWRFSLTWKVYSLLLLVSYLVELGSSWVVNGCTTHLPYWEILISNGNTITIMPSISKMWSQGSNTMICSMEVFLADVVRLTVYTSEYNLRATYSKLDEGLNDMCWIWDGWISIKSKTLAVRCELCLFCSYSIVDYCSLLL